MSDNNSTNTQETKKVSKSRFFGFFTLDRRAKKENEKLKAELEEKEKELEETKKATGADEPEEAKTEPETEKAETEETKEVKPEEPKSDEKDANEAESDKVDETPKEQPKATSLGDLKSLIEADESALEELLPYFEKYVSKHHAYREVIIAAPPRKKLEVRYRDRLNPGSEELLKLKEVEAILKKDYDKADRDDAFKLRFKEVECYPDGTPASEEDVRAYKKARTPSPEGTPGDSSSSDDSSAA